MKYRLITSLALITVCACSEFVDVEAPTTDLVKETVFSSDATATAALLDIYSQLAANGFASGDMNSITFVTSLSSDELLNFNTGPGAGQTLMQFNDNSLQPNNQLITALWSELYKTIYKANAIIEGVELSSGVTETLRHQLVAEAKFLRAFCHLYLAALWGDVPLVTTTDYRINQSLGRNAIDEVYQQIVSDLKDAQSDLPGDYSPYGNERVRPSRQAATAVLARVYMYLEDWPGAEAEVSKIINGGLHSLQTDLNAVFNANSDEAIWQLHSIYPAKDAFTFRLTQTSRRSALRNDLVAAFESGDLRKERWIGSVIDGANTFYYSSKYKGIDYSNVTEYTTVLRLSEQFLIRAEARARQNNTSGALEDLNTIRQRGGLDPSIAVTADAIINEIHQERRFELFAEWGHRWFDLKRSGSVDNVLASLKPTWSPHAALYPIPETQILNDIAMKDAQNPGY